jgi:hypothetical protein
VSKAGIKSRLKPAAIESHRESGISAPIVQPPKRRRGLLVVLLVLLALWEAFLIVMYFTTVRGR